MERNPFDIIKYRHITEKTTVLAGLHQAQSNKCLKKYIYPKAVFIVDNRATKTDIAWAVEAIYAEKHVKVLSVNTITVKPKKRRVRGYVGLTKKWKKAIVTLESGDSIDEQV